MNRPQQFTNVDLKPRRFHGYVVLLFILGTLLPPLAVAARFGAGKDFFLNIILTLCGYIPGHVHNFYIQNIRNNKNHRRTPKWVARYGLVDTSEIERKKKKSQWATRYSERLPTSTLEGQEVEEGQVAERSSDNVHEDGPSQIGQGKLWTREEESYYGASGSSPSLKSTGSAGRWKYPANFEDTDPLPGGKKRKGKKDRWARTDDAHMGVGMDDSSQKKKKKKTKKSNRRAEEANGDFINPRRGSYDSSTVEGPEDPSGQQYDPSRHESAPNGSGPAGAQGDELEHHF